MFSVLGQIGARIRLRRCSTKFRPLQMSASTFARTLVARSSPLQVPTTPDVCFDFCKNACGAQFSSLKNGRDCFCTPQLHNHKGGNVDATQRAKVNNVIFCCGLTGLLCLRCTIVSTRHLHEQVSTTSFAGSSRTSCAPVFAVSHDHIFGQTRAMSLNFRSVSLAFALLCQHEFGC